MQSERRHEDTQRGLFPDPNDSNCEQSLELGKLKRGSHPLQHYVFLNLVTVILLELQKIHA